MAQGPDTIGLLPQVLLLKQSLLCFEELKYVILLA